MEQDHKEKVTESIQNFIPDIITAYEFLMEQEFFKPFNKETILTMATKLVLQEEYLTYLGELQDEITDYLVEFKKLLYQIQINTE
jgi:hypothetical protein